MVKPHEKMCVREVIQSNYRLYKTLKDFWINDSCTQYRKRKIQARRSRNDMHVSRLCTKPYGRHILHVKPMHTMYHTKSWRRMDE